jgi:mono/diheme cytochrome c family protein
MSDLSAAAAKLGVSEAILKRSAEARAKATGASIDEILKAWAGGEAAPQPVASPQSPVSSPPESVANFQAPVAGSEPVASPITSTVPAGDRRPVTGDRALLTGSRLPVLVGRREAFVGTVAGSVGLMLLTLLLGFYLPSLPQPSNGVRSSNHPYSARAIAGQEIYLEEGCASCHTQLIRNVVSDVNLGPVTLDDTNQVIGARRIGPDLAAIGRRIEDANAVRTLLAGEGNHPASVLSEEDISNLIAYLVEST